MWITTQEGVLLNLDQIFTIEQWDKDIKFCLNDDVVHTSRFANPELANDYLDALREKIAPNS